MDEKGCQLTLHHQQSMLTRKGIKKVHLLAPEHVKNISIVRQSIPPLLIFKGVRIIPEGNFEAYWDKEILNYWVSHPNERTMLEQGLRKYLHHNRNMAVIPEPAFAPSVLTNRVFVKEVMEDVCENNAQVSNQTSDEPAAGPIGVKPPKKKSQSRKKILKTTYFHNDSELCGSYTSDKSSKYSNENDYLHNETEEEEPTDKMKERMNGKEASENLDISFIECGLLTTSELKVSTKERRPAINSNAQGVSRKLFSAISANLQLRKISDERTNLNLNNGNKQETKKTH
ncbi:hypothetical protein ILUMI_03552 [Ignelater luminosus]|uniref:Uncharacterized protein n=1 Tax=Ignelater luminosus TaxID=2038154 RepID=A0A8K0GI78_IGNLU|nr:hypothetical protein ILUMI_03552 [Ignelater luminosus]